MNSVHLIFLFCIILIPDAFSQSCEPDDEFENEETPQWDSFMDKITELTFNNYDMSCQSNVSQKVTINASSDFLWELRFAVYNERQHREQETIEKCYAEQEKGMCDKISFRECMKKARTHMLEDVTSEWWNNSIDEELRKMAERC